MKYIVTGCDGQLGGRVAANMLKEVSAQDLIFTCPNMERLSAEKKKTWETAGVTIRQANYDNVSEMTEAFRGGERIYVVSSILNGPERVVQHKNVFDACVAAGVKHIVYTSFFGANRPDYHQYVLPDHTATEAYLKEMSCRLGFTYNVMRNNLYMENYLTNSVMLANLSDFVWGTNAKEGRFTPIAKDDSAACAAALLLGKGTDNTDYDLTSEHPINQREICAMVAERSGKPYKFVSMNDEEFYAYLDNLGISRGTEGYKSTAPVLWCSNDMVTNEGGIANGQMGVISHDVEKLLGRKPLEVKDIIDKYSYMWEENVKSWRGIR
ncbi:MAG: NmrA family NAD(P)-binding protein [Lachnospiraceae bacterium]|nr:NmrA family NAD(P)-binding protein [Lachnospiraceae bacterium]